MKRLDATCGLRSIWQEKHNKDTTYIDIRPEVRPDFVCDATRTPFHNQAFDMILFDPPHRKFSPYIKSLGKRSMAFRYGSQTTAERNDFVRAAFIEFSRILKDDGVVLFKWNDCGTPITKILPLCVGWVVMFGQNFARANHQNGTGTTWVCLRKADGTQKVLA